MAVIIVEGQRFTMPDEDAAVDERVKDALKVAFPEVTTANISRETKDGVMHVTVVKQAGRKGLAEGTATQGTLNIIEDLEWSVPMDLPASSIRTDGNTQTRAMTFSEVSAGLRRQDQARGEVPSAQSSRRICVALGWRR